MSNPDPDGLDSADGGVGKAIISVVKILTRKKMRKWFPVIILSVLLTLLASVLEILSPLVIGAAINKIAEITGSSDGISMKQALLFLAFGIFLRFAAAGIPQLRDLMFLPVSQNAQRVAVVEAFEHAQHLSLNFHQTRRVGALNRIIERAANSIDYLIRFLAFNIGPTFFRLIMAAVVLALAFDIIYSVIAVVSVVIYATVTLIVTEYRVKQRRRMNEADTETKAVAIDSLTNFETVKAFAAEKRVTRRFDEALKQFNRKFITAMRSMYLLNLAQALILNAGLLGVLAIGAFSVVNGSLQIGDLTAVMLMMLSLFAPLNILGFALREIKQGAVDLEKMHGLLAKVPEVADSATAKPLLTPVGHVEFQNVCFSHEGRQNNLDGVTFDVPAGKKLAIVGKSGAGKSTILKLLFRFYDVKTGNVRVDNLDVRNLQQESLRNALGLVSQDVVLFNDTIRANVEFGRPDVSEDKIIEAIERAQLKDFVKSLPKGLDTIVGERGLKLSGGEKQRVGIARVILRDPAILVLDEATSALDSSTEAAVQKALNEIAMNRTTLMVAHRLSTIVNADEIIVLDDGRISERGNHQDLLAKNGYYSKMWLQQAKSSSRSSSMRLAG